MYATEKYVRQEAKELHAQVREVATDLGGDLRYLASELQEMRARIEILEANIKELREIIDDHS